MANVKFTNPSEKDLSGKPVYVSDLAMALGADFGEMVQDEAGQMVPSGKFWTNGLHVSSDDHVFGKVADAADQAAHINQVHDNSVGVLPCIKNAAENGITTARLTNDQNDTREYLYDEKTQSFKMAPQTFVGFNLGYELEDLLQGNFERRLADLEKDYQNGRVGQELYTKKLADLQAKQSSFAVVEDGFPTVQRVGATEDHLKRLTTVVCNGETYARYTVDSFRNMNNPVKNGAKFNNGVTTIYDQEKGGGSYWFKFEPILAERQANGDVQLRTVLMPAPYMQKDKQAEFNQAVAKMQDGTLDKPFHTLVHTYMNVFLAQQLGYTTDLIVERAQQNQQNQDQAQETERNM